VTSATFRPPLTPPFAVTSRGGRGRERAVPQICSPGRDPGEAGTVAQARERARGRARPSTPDVATEEQPKGGLGGVGEGQAGIPIGDYLEECCSHTRCWPAHCTEHMMLPHMFAKIGPRSAGSGRRNCCRRGALSGVNYSYRQK